MADHAEYNTVVPIENHAKNVPKPDKVSPPSEAILEGRRTAEANFKAEQKNNTSSPADNPLEGENIESAQELAKLNHKVDVENTTEGGLYSIAKNDTSKAGKTRTSKSQLDPAGNDPISDAEVKRAAVAGRTVKGETSVSDKEVAARASKPGEAEEKNPISTARDGVEEDTTVADSDAVHTNENEGKTTGEGGMADLVGPANKTVDGAKSGKDEAPAR